MAEIPVKTSSPLVDNDLNALADSPFCPGVPLEAHQPLFGRMDALNFVASELMRFKSVNLIGERRIGKTSLLNHLIGNQNHHFRCYSNIAQLVLVRLDLQESISKTEQFYGKALRCLLETLPEHVLLSYRPLQTLSTRIATLPEATAIEFEDTLKILKSANIRPVLLIDEFDRTFDDKYASIFPYPDFFDQLRSQVTQNRIAFVLFTRHKLIDYFTKRTITSTFPNYFQPFSIVELDEESADKLLLQPFNNFCLNTEQARHARMWAGLHPCRLQCAGAVWYQANVQGKSYNWSYSRYNDIVKQLGFTNPLSLPVTSAQGMAHRLNNPRIWTVVALVCMLSILTYYKKFYLLSQIFNWVEYNKTLTGAAIIFLMFLFGSITISQVRKMILGIIGYSSREDKKT